MNHFRLVAIGTMFAFALTAPAQQSATDSHTQHAAQAHPASVEQQLKVLTQRLDLTGDQPARIKPILQELHDGTQKIVDDKSLSRDERHAQARPLFYKADQQMRAILTDDQQKKLDQYEQGPHPEMHGGLETP